MGFQPQAVDISDIGYVHPHSTFSISPTSNIHASDETKQTKYGKWAHLCPPVWAAGMTHLGTMYSDYYLIPTRYKQQ